MHKQVASLIKNSDAFVFMAGAGMGVDSGLPDFRGDDGFWKAYPPLRHLNISFVQAANPEFFENNYEMAWGFYGHRLNLYRKTIPHEGFDILKKFAKDKEYFVYTSNVDGSFQKAGFNKSSILECHGSIHHFQCMEDCTKEIFFNDLIVKIDEAAGKADTSNLKCPKCGGRIRPNILMFGDGGFSRGLLNIQKLEYQKFLSANKDKKVCIFECGAGTEIPTIRIVSSGLTYENKGFHLIRINLRESDVHEKIKNKSTSFAAKAKDTLKEIYSYL